MGPSRNGLSKFSLFQIREQYGPVFNSPLIPQPAVMSWVNDAMTEVVVDPAESFSGRGEQAFFDWFFKGYGENDSTWGN